MRRRGSIVSIVVVLSAAAAMLGLYASTALASPTACSGNTCTWGGQGATNGSLDSVECDAANDPNGANQPYLLWIFTTGGSGSVSSATLTLGGSGAGIYTGTAHGNEFHFVTPYYTPDTSTLTASVTFVGRIGNAQLVISHGCAGGNDTTPPTCALTSYTTYPSSTEKSSITVTLQDAGSGIQTVTATATNATVSMTPFTAPTTSPVVVTATKTTQGEAATLDIVVADAAGNTKTCDPVLHRAGHAAAQRHALSGRGETVRSAGLTLRISSSSLTYGASPSVTLSGAVSDAPAGTPVTILSQPYGFDGFASVATVATGAGGTFSYRFHPGLRSVFAVSVNGVVSPTVRMRVQPLVQLTRTAYGHYRVDVTTTNPLFLAGGKVLLQKLRGRHWVTIAKTGLRKNSTDTGTTVTSSGTFATRKGVGLRLRAVVGGSGWYDRGVSAMIRG